MPAPQTAPTGTIETPFLRAKQEWDERLGSARVQARNWRLMALGCLGANLVLGLGLIYQSTKAVVVPYVVEISTAGEVRSVGPAQVLYRPTQAAMEYQVREFVRTIRGLATDPVVVRERWLQAYAWGTPRAANLLNDYARERDPFGKVGKISIAVDVQRILALTDTSFDVRWVETTYDERGVKKEQHAYSGIFGLIVKAPKTEQDLRANPLGLYIDSFAITSTGPGGLQ